MATRAAPTGRGRPRARRGDRRDRPVVRLVAAAGAVLLLAAACTAGEGPGDEEPHRIVIDGEQEEEPQPEDAAGDADTGEPQPEPEQEPDEGTGRQPPEGAEPAPEPPAEPEPTTRVPDDAGPLGSACRDYLREDIPRLRVEVLHQRGAEPRTAAVDHLLGTLREVVAKPGGVQLVGPRQIPGDGRTWTVEALRAHAAEHRSVRSSSEEMAMVVLSVAGDFEREGVLGVALSATELVLFPDNVGDLATALLGGRQAIERAVLVHEAGHLLCLVNISYTSEIDHEDPDNPHHSRHRDSVMYWAVPNDAVTQVFTGPPPDTFHPDDLADLRGLREGRY